MAIKHLILARGRLGGVNFIPTTGLTPSSVGPPSTMGRVVAAQGSVAGAQDAEGFTAGARQAQGSVAGAQAALGSLD